LCGVGLGISENGKTAVSRNERQQARTSFIRMRTSNCCPQAIYRSQFRDSLLFWPQQSLQNEIDQDISALTTPGDPLFTSGDFEISSERMQSLCGL
jgi:hypothetical protein